MPSKREECDIATRGRGDIITRDVEELVQEIRENLRLKARPSTAAARKDRRVQPYSTSTTSTSSTRHKEQETEPQDPYEALQRLLESNKLVAEAVRRLQQDLTDFSLKPFLYPDEESECRVMPPVCRHLGVMLRSSFIKLSTRMVNEGAVNNVGKFWSMGNETHEIPLSLYSLNRQRLSNKIDKESIIVLQGGVDVPFNDTDVDYVFRQESFFTWACGVREPGCYLFITGSSGTSYLFVPRLPDSYAVWMGRLHTTDDFKTLYGVDHVYYTDQMLEILESLKPSKVLVLHGKNSDSGLTTREVNFDGINKFEIDKTTLYPIMAELRVTKTDLEIEAMRYVVKVSSEAHKKVMLYIKPGRTEYQCESVFLHHCYGEGGCRHVSYTCICGSGNNGSVLHYGHAGAPNAKKIHNGDMCLFDMGANYGGYAADITCSFPANGKFTEDQKLIYNAVLAARTAVIKAAAPGVSWKEMHLLANRVMLQYLIDGNLLIGNVDDMMKDNINCILQPHGLGHLLGLDVHDVGGYLDHCPPRPDPPLSSLRTTRVLKAGMVLTVEPGCYFIDALLDKALADPNQAKYFNKEYLQKFRNFGGVRIEDNVLITENGAEDLTQVPRTVEEIEEFMSKGANFSANN